MTKGGGYGILCKVFYFTAGVVINMFVKNMRFPILLDTYGVLFSDRKRELLDYYYNEDYSLTEISELTGISRQGVRDSIKKCEEEIFSIESKLKLVETTEKMRSSLSEVIAELETIAESNTNSDLRLAVEKLKSIRSSLGQDSFDDIPEKSDT